MKKIDLRHTLEYKAFRELVMLSQNICQRCGSDHKLQLHHLKICAKFPELILDRSNVIVLCTKCHHQLHNMVKRRK